ncbi:hypothetical protein RB595_008398 [Gaeumannomyces hyphopodioides]
MHLLSLLPLAAACSAAVVPRQEAAATDSEIHNWMAGPFPADNSALRIAAPEVLTLSVGEIMEKGGNATVAAPSPDMVAPGGGVERRDVFGADDRVLRTDTTYPWSAMGRLLIQSPNGNYICSASMVGARVLLAARHCIVDGASYTFSPAYYNGDRFPTSFATLVIRIPGNNEDNGGCGWKDDWALFILNRNPGNGYLGFKTFPDSLSGASADWWNYGYPGDKSPSGTYAQNRFKVRKSPGCGSSEGGALVSDADAAGGQSGGPVWIPESDGRYQYAVLVGGSSQSTILSHGSALLNAIVGARRDYP